MDFHFLDPGPLIDRELELVAPDSRWLDEFMNACAHPQSRADALASSFTRQKVLDFLRAAPGGHHFGYASSERGAVPIYSFWMRLSPPAASADVSGAARVAATGAVPVPANVSWSAPAASTFPVPLHALPTWGNADPPIRIGGTVGLRIGTSRDLELYYGHFGYNVFPPARGNHYAERACRLLLPLARAHAVRTLWITCNPENLASRRTCERLGCTLVNTVRIPAGHALYLRGEREKCRYRLDLD